MPPSHVDVGFHIVSHDNEFRRKAVVIGAKAHDVDLSHSGRKNSEKIRGEQGGAGFTLGPLFISQCRVYDSKPLTAVIEMKGKSVDLCVQKYFMRQLLQNESDFFNP